VKAMGRAAIGIKSRSIVQDVTGNILWHGFKKLGAKLIGGRLGTPSALHYVPSSTLDKGLWGWKLIASTGTMLKKIWDGIYSDEGVDIVDAAKAGGEVA